MFLKVLEIIGELIGYFLMALIVFALAVSKWRINIKQYRDRSHGQYFSPYLAVAFLLALFWPAGLAILLLCTILYLPYKVISSLIMLSYNVGMGRSNVHLGRRIKGLFWHTTARIVHEH
jgi:hypothetical protein